MPGCSSTGLPRRFKAEARVRNEARKIASLSLEHDGICVDVDSAAPGKVWTAYLQGPLGTMWEAAVFKLEAIFPERYPMEPLEVKFVHGIFHPNVDKAGHICTQLTGDQWSPIFTLQTVLIYIRSLLCSPNFSAEDLDRPVDEAQAVAEAEAFREQGGRTLPSKLYHYTSPQAIERIRKSSVLKESESGAGGSGVYASSLHPTNRTKEQILSSNYGWQFQQASTPHAFKHTQTAGKLSAESTSRADFVIELDVAQLAHEGHVTSKVKLGPGRDVWLIKSGDIHLHSANSSIAVFEHFASCTLNKHAESMYKGDQSKYEELVLETIRRFGQEMPSARRQSFKQVEQSFHRTLENNTADLQSACTSSSSPSTSQSQSTTCHDLLRDKGNNNKRRKISACNENNTTAVPLEESSSACAEPAAIPAVGLVTPVSELSSSTAYRSKASAVIEKTDKNLLPSEGTEDMDFDLRLALELSRKEAEAEHSRRRAEHDSLPVFCIEDSD